MSWRPDYWKIPDEVWAYNQETAYEAGVDAMLEARDKAWRDVILSLDLESDNSMWGNELFRSRILLLTLIPEETKGG